MHPIVRLREAVHVQTPTVSGNGHISALLRYNVLKVGMSLSCTECLHTSWFSLEDIKPTVKCPRCMAEFQFQQINRRVIHGRIRSRGRLPPRTMHTAHIVSLRRFVISLRKTNAAQRYSQLPDEGHSGEGTGGGFRHVCRSNPLGPRHCTVPGFWRVQIIQIGWKQRTSLGRVHWQRRFRAQSYVSRLSTNRFHRKRSRR